MAIWAADVCSRAARQLICIQPTGLTLRHIGKTDPKCGTVQFCFHSGRLTCSARTGFRAVTTPPTRCRPIDSLYVWFCANDMALNPNKSEAILLGTRQRAHSYSSLATVNVVGSQIPLADHIKILGVTLDKNLSMNNHVSVICKSVHYHIRALRRIRSSISEDIYGCVCSRWLSPRLS